MEHKRFWEKVYKTDSCWVWSAAISTHGYGIFDGRGAHRFAYALTYGQIPDGLTVDHICHNEDTECPGGVACLHRRCVNPEHLEAVSLKTNIQRGRRGWKRGDCCTKGHAFTPENTRYFEGRRKYGDRYCVTCKRAYDAARYLSRKTSVAS